MVSLQPYTDSTTQTTQDIRTHKGRLHTLPSSGYKECECCATHTGLRPRGTLIPLQDDVSVFRNIVLPLTASPAPTTAL